MSEIKPMLTKFVKPCSKSNTVRGWPLYIMHTK